MLTFVNSLRQTLARWWREQPAEKREDARKLAIPFTILAVALLVIYATPVAEWCMGAWVLWFLLAKFDNPWAKAAASKVFSYACGLIPAVVVLLVFANVPPTGAAAPVAKIEELVVGLDKDFKGLKDFLNVPGTVGILVALILLSRYHPRWKAAQRYSWLSGGIETATAIVGVAASFSFFTDVAVTQSAEKVYTRLEAIYHESPEHRGKYLAQEIIAKNLTAAAKAPASPQWCRPAVQYLAELGDPSMTKELLKDLLEYRDGAGPPHGADAEARPVTERAKERDAKEPLPPRDQIVEIAKARQKAETEAKAEAENAKKELEATLDQEIAMNNDAIGDQVKDLVGLLLDKWGGELVAHWKETASEYLSEVTKESLERVGEKLRERFVDRFENLFPGPVKGNAEIAAQFEKSELTKLEKLTRQANELEQKPTDYSRENAPEAELKRLGEQKAALDAAINQLQAASNRATLVGNHGGSSSLQSAAGSAREKVTLLTINHTQLEASEGRIQREQHLEKVGERKVPEMVPHPGG